MPSDTWGQSPIISDYQFNFAMLFAIDHMFQKYPGWQLAG